MSFMLNPFILHPADSGGIPTDYVARYLFDGDYTDETGTYNGTNSGSSFVGAGNGPNGTNYGIVTGGGNYVELGAALATALGAGAGTMSFAFKYTSTVANDGVLLASADSASATNFTGFTIRNDSGKLRGVIDGGNAFTADNTVTVNTWHHGVIRVNGSTTSFRINGTNSTRTVDAGTDNGDWFGDPTSLDFMTIGAIRDLTPFNGVSFEIALLTLYNRELSDAECAALESEY